MSLRDLPSHDFLDDEQRERAALHALGALGEAEAAEYERHLETCEACRKVSELERATADELAQAASCAELPADLKSRLFDRLGLNSDVVAATTASELPAQAWRTWSDDGDRDTASTYLPATAGEFEATQFDGVSARRLFVDRERDQVTMLIRMEAGASYPAHVHGGPEECFVLEGDLHVGEHLHMQAGDFQRVESGQEHPVQSTDGGCLLLIMSSLQDELLDEAG